MLLKFLCKTGSMQLSEDGMLSVWAPFAKTPAWSIPVGSITKIITQPSGLSLNLTIYTQQSQYAADTVARRNYEKLLQYMQNVETQEVGSQWYYDPRKLTHVASYDNEKQMQREVEAAVQNGWSIQSTTGINGHVNVGRTATAAFLTGGFSLMFGASRTKSKVTVTYQRNR